MNTLKYNHDPATEHRDRYGVIYRTKRKFSEPRKYLIVKEIGAPGYWGFPKGSQEILNKAQVETEGAQPIWELPSQTAKREIREEIGVDIEEITLKSSPMITVHPNPHCLTRQYNYFIVDIEHQFDCTINKLEIADYRWVSLSELKRLNKATFTTHAMNYLYKLK